MTLLLKSRLLTTLVLLSISHSASAALFEGYYKVVMAGKPLGYVIQRYDLDAKDKSFTSTYFVYTKSSDGATTTESLNAKADEKLLPLSYQFTRLEGKNSKVIDAITKKDGKKNKFVIKTVENGKASSKEVPLTDKTFLSTFLSHLMLKNPKGIQVGNKYAFEAFAEEDGKLQSGEAFVKEQVKEKGMDTFRILYKVKGEEYVNWMNNKGESVKAHFPHIDLTLELVADPKEATKGFPSHDTSVKLLFGDIPKGTDNMLSKK